MPDFRSVIAVILMSAALSPAAAKDPTLRIAVASNFRATAEALVSDFRESRPADVSISAASTGKLYAQIVNGAPFHVLLAADEERPGRLEASGLAVAGSRFTYALGRLVLWSRDKSIGGPDCLAALRRGDGGRVAMANPATAPYGLAARQALESLGMWELMKDRLVYGENVSQSLQFTVSGNASLGFVAASLLRLDSLPAATCRWDVPPGHHDPIRQQAVLLGRGADHPAARDFVDYLRGADARRIIRRHAYGLEPTE